jgi:type IV pilus assembly protein PilN
MIKINLLPREERRRAAPVSTSRIGGVVGAVIVVAVLGAGWFWLNTEVGRLQAAIQQTQAEYKRYEEEAKLVERFRADKNRLEEKIKIIETLVAAQRGPVRILDEVSKALPNEVWLTSINRTGKRLEISGIAFSNFSVAAYMTNLGKASDWITGVDLVISEKTTVEQVPVERFTITMELKEGKT